MSESVETAKPWTIRRLVEWATEDFRARGIESPRLDADLLVGHVLGLTRTQLILDFERPLSPAELAKLRALVLRRRAREPMAYVLGSREFYGRSFAVDARVLVPRPDTETLIDTALARTRARSLHLRVLDLCTGSGAVAITLAKERRTTEVVGTDISEDALAVARANAQALGAYNVGFVRADLFDGLDTAVGRRPYDLIVSNPPYIPSAEIATLMADVRDHEPRLALDGGDDGLDFYRRLADDAPAWLTPGGVLAVEVGAGQADDVSELLGARGFAELRQDRDLARIARVVSGTWNA